MKRSILIFGAGINQITLIQAAQKLGLISVVLDPNPDSPGKELADFYYNISGKDYVTTREIALKHKVCGLVTTQMEKPMRLMAKLAQELDLNFHSPDVVERSLDKWLMKQTFLEHHVPCAIGKVFKADQRINEDNLKEFKFPLILKPKDGTSSQGVFRIERFSEIERYIKITSQFSRNGEILIEEFLEGPEYSIETITFREKTTVVQYTEKMITCFPHTVEMGHLQPANLGRVNRNKIDKVVKSAIKAIGIDNSAAHTEIILTEKGPKIVEIGARGGGDFISSYLTFHSCGVNMDMASIQVVLGEKPDLTTSFNKYSYIKYLELPACKKVISIGNWESVSSGVGHVFAHLNIKEGDIIPEITESSKRPGFVIMEGHSREEVISRAEKSLNALKAAIKLK